MFGGIHQEIIWDLKKKKGKKEKNHRQFNEFNVFQFFKQDWIEQISEKQHGYHWFESYAINACSSIE